MVDTAIDSVNITIILSHLHIYQTPRKTISTNIETGWNYTKTVPTYVLSILNAKKSNTDKSVRLLYESLRKSITKSFG